MGSTFLGGCLIELGRIAAAPGQAASSAGRLLDVEPLIVIGIRWQQTCLPIITTGLRLQGFKPPRRYS